MNNKANLLWSILCTSSTVDSDSNNLSLYNLVEQFNVKISEDAYKSHKENKTKGFMIPTALTLVSRIHKAEKDEAIIMNMQMEFINPEGEVLMANEHTLDFKKGVTNIRTRDILNTLPVQKSGRYEFVVKIREVGDAKYSQINRLPLDLVVELPKK